MVVSLRLDFTQKRCTPARPQSNMFEATGSAGEGEGEMLMLPERGQTLYLLRTNYLRCLLSNLNGIIVQWLPFYCDSCFEYEKTEAQTG